jgi:hypothetical protein
VSEPPWKPVIAVNTATTLLAMTVSVLIAADPGIALPAGETITTGVQTYALATAIRSLAIGAILLWALTTRRRDATTALLLVTGLIQTGDAAVHLTNANPAAAAAGVLAIIAFVSSRALRVNRDALS